MIKILRVLFLSLMLGIFHWSEVVQAQDISSGFPVLEEMMRRNQLNGYTPIDRSFTLRPINQLKNNSIDAVLTSQPDSVSNERQNPNRWFLILPLLSKSNYTSKRPYGYGQGMMHPNVGFQTYLTGGVSGRFGIFRFRLQPEVLFSQNQTYQGFSDQFSEYVIKSRFRFWNTGDYPELYADGPQFKGWWGQSSLSLVVGGFELGASTENVWWGPGQWNSLIFANNAQGFAHLTLKSHKPLKTFLGNFEMQLLSGRLESSGRSATQNGELNRTYGRSLSNDWRYLNALMITYNPKWVKGLFMGASRSQQQYSRMMDGSLKQLFPVLEAFQKVNFGFDRDSEGRDQQLTMFMRYVAPAAKTEIYWEFGRRDHGYNWREVILNPEHARAYLFGFVKLVDISKNRQLQIRGEVVQQQESVNRYIRYLGLSGNTTWHTHWTARGFTNYGEALGVGIGVGSNSQKLELAIVEGTEKYGLQFERLVNQQDFFYRAFGQEKGKNPWIDYTLGLLWTMQKDKFIFNSKLDFIGASNYQWEMNRINSADFPRKSFDVSVQASLEMIYLLH